MKKIIILIPVFGRIEIFKLCIKSIWNLIDTYNSKYQFQPVIIISNNDPVHLQFRAICEIMEFMYIYWTNKPIGAKLNAVITDIHKNMEFDYLMNFGSDNLINPELFQVYKPYIKEGNKFFGINNAYLFDVLTNSCVLFKCLGIDHAIGAGRMIHHDIITHLQMIKQSLYVNEYNSGLDSCSASIIKFDCKTNETIIDTGDIPYILDIKNENNINTFESISKIFSDRLIYKNFDEVYNHFGNAGKSLKTMCYVNNKR